MLYDIAAALMVIFIVIFIVIGILLAIGTIKRRRQAISNHENVAWLEDQLQRALRQIYSTNEDDILAGFQTLSMLNDPKSRLKALDRVSELMNDDSNPRIARQAEITYRRIVSSLSGST